MVYVELHMNIFMKNHIEALGQLTGLDFKNAIKLYDKLRRYERRANELMNIRSERNFTSSEFMEIVEIEDAVRDLLNYRSDFFMESDPRSCTLKLKHSESMPVGLSLDFSGSYVQLAPKF